MNAHHQNGITERHIRSITEKARTIMIHAMIQWPEIITETLWLFALKLAVDIHNKTPGPSDMTLEEIFTDIKQRNKFLDSHPFGCPIFVLDPSLQQGHNIPRWKPRSRMGIFVGYSLHHASAVPLVLSTSTGLVSPQFHVIFDDSFSTTTCLQTNELPNHWSDLLQSSTYKITDEDFQPSVFTDTSWFDDSVNQTSSTQREIISTNQREEPTLPLSQREDSTSSTLQREDAMSAPPPGWNSQHKYQTRFKKRHLSNISITLDNDADNTPFDDSLYSAFIAAQDSYPIQ